MKFVPLPCLEWISQRAAELADFAGDHVHADAAAGEAADGSRRWRSPARGSGCPGRSSDSSASALDQAALDRRCRGSPAVRGRRPSSLTFSTTSDPSRRTAMRTVPSSGLPALRRSFRRFQAVRDRVAQHVFQRRGHAFEHVAIEFAVRRHRASAGPACRYRSRPGAARGAGAAPARRTAPCACASGLPAVPSSRATAAAAGFRTGGSGRRATPCRLTRSVADSASRATAAAWLVKRSSSSGSKRLVVGLVLALVARDDLRLGFDVQAAQLVAQSRRWSAPVRRGRRGTRRAAVPGARGRSRPRRRS